MNNTNKKELAILNHLAGIAADGKNGYQKAAVTVCDVNLKYLFTRFSHERAAFQEEIRQLIKKIG